MHYLFQAKRIEFRIKQVLNMAHQITRYFRKAMALLGSSLMGWKAIAHSPANRVGSLFAEDKSCLSQQTSHL